MSLTGAAQAVQRSAFPNAYARWEALARGILAGSNGAGLDMGPDAMGFEPEPMDGMIPSTPGGGFYMDPVYLPGVSRSTESQFNPEAELDTSQIRDIRDQGPYNRATSSPNIRNLLYGTEDEEPYNRSTHQPSMGELREQRRKKQERAIPFNRSTSQPAPAPFNLRSLLYG
jgi:hypothetical protein